MIRLFTVSNKINYNFKFLLVFIYPTNVETGTQIKEEAGTLKLMWIKSRGSKLVRGRRRKDDVEMVWYNEKRKRTDEQRVKGKELSFQQ